jgi:membrane protein
MVLMMAAHDTQAEGSSLGARAVAAYRRGRSFFTNELWETNLDTLSASKARRYRLLRVAATVVDGLFIGDTLPLHAAALTYYAVLSIVPLLAFVFAILKGFGAYDALVEETLRPYLLTATSTNPALRRAFEHVLDFVSQTGVTSLGFLGLVFTLYAATRLLRNVETALNGIWGAPDERAITEQLKNYVTILVVTPLCLLMAAGLATTAQLVHALNFLRERLGLGGLLDWALQLFGPVLVILIGLFFLYLLMPNTTVRARSAFLGAVVGGALWYVFLLLHVRFQVGVARYNALYSSFATIPIFLVWTYVSWLSVLVGAQSAAAHQQGEARARQHRWAELDQANKEALALSILLGVAQPFAAGEPPRVSLRALSERFGAPLSVVRNVVDRLVRAELLVAPNEDCDQPLTLARAPEHVRVLDALKAFRGSLIEQQSPPFAPVSRALYVLLSLEETLGSSNHNRSLADLIEQERAA